MQAQHFLKPAKSLGFVVFVDMRLKLKFAHPWTFL